jgi:hypothetical protein
MTTIWIEQALRAGGKLTVDIINVNYFGRIVREFRATMSWVGEDDIECVGSSFQYAICNLDRALEDDAADEMIKSGTV